ERRNESIPLPADGRLDVLKPRSDGGDAAAAVESEHLPPERGERNQVDGAERAQKQPSDDASRGGLRPAAQKPSIDDRRKAPMARNEPVDALGNPPNHRQSADERCRPETGRASEQAKHRLRPFVYSPAGLDELNGSPSSPS